MNDLTGVRAERQIHEKYVVKLKLKEKAKEKELDHEKGALEQHLALLSFMNKRAQPAIQPLTSSPIRMNSASSFSPVRRSYAKAVARTSDEEPTAEEPIAESTEQAVDLTNQLISEFPTYQSPWGCGILYNVFASNGVDTGPSITN